MQYFSSAWRCSSAFSLCTFSPPRNFSMAASRLALLAPAAFSAAPSSPLSSSAAKHEQLAGDELIAALLRKLVGEVEQSRQLVADVDVAFLPADSSAGGRCCSFMRWRSAGTLTCACVSNGAVEPPCWSSKRSHDVHRFKHVVVAPDGQRLRVGQRLLETRREFVHPHGYAPHEGDLAAWPPLPEEMRTPSHDSSAAVITWISRLQFFAGIIHS